MLVFNINLDGSIKSAIIDFFGKVRADSMMRDCLWHAQQDMRRHSKRIPDETDREYFINTAYVWFTSETMKGAFERKKELQDFVKRHPYLTHWLNFWIRIEKYLIAAFTEAGMTRTSLAEAFFSKNGSLKYMSLENAVRLWIVYVAELKAKENSLIDGSYSGGNGPSMAEQQRRRDCASERRYTFIRQKKRDSKVFPTLK